MRFPAIRLALVLCVSLASGCSVGSSAGTGGGPGSTSSGATVASVSSVASGATTSATAGTGTGTFTLTSPELGAGAMFSPANTCKGTNVSPSLDWTPGPPSTQSYAVVLTDKSINLVHWGIWDIPASLTGLPADVQKAYLPANVSGAMQSLAYDNQTRGYLGPCPPSLHTYELDLYALDTASVPGLDTNTTRAQAVTVILAHQVASAALMGTAMP